MPTLVLVHGGSVSSRAWDPVLEHLRSPRLVVDLPGRRYKPADLGTLTRADWERSVLDDVADAGLDDLVLVGHSSGGYVIPGVAAGLPPGVVRHLVFVASTCPAEGQRPVDAMTEKLAARARDNEAALRAGANGRTLAELRPGEPPIETDLELVDLGGHMGLEAPAQLSFAREGGSGTDVPDFSIEVDNFDEVRDRIVAAGLPIEYGPTVESWGVRRLFVRDPFGKLVNILSHL